MVATSTHEASGNNVPMLRTVRHAPTGTSPPGAGTAGAAASATEHPAGDGLYQCLLIISDKTVRDSMTGNSTTKGDDPRPGGDGGRLVGSAPGGSSRAHSA